MLATMEAQSGLGQGSGRLRLGCRQGQGCTGLRQGRGTGGSVVQGAISGSGSDGGGRGWETQGFAGRENVK